MILRFGEFGAQNRTECWDLWLTLAIPLGAAEKER